MSQTTDAVIAELMDRRLLNDVDDGLHQEIAEAVIKAAQPAVTDDEPLSARDLAMIDQAWENHKAALPVATVINDNQPGRTAIIEITIDPPTLPVGTKLYAGPKMVELAAETSPGDDAEKVNWTPFEDGTAPWSEDEQFEERAKACKSRCKQYGYTCGQGGEEDYEYEGECDECDRDAQEVLRKKHLKPAAIDRLDVKAEAKSQEPDAVGTPAARWREEGKPDPHGNRFNGERSALCGGSMTDDEIANAVYLNPSIMNLTAAKERIRWLSRKLCSTHSTTKPEAPAVSVDAIKHFEDRIQKYVTQLNATGQADVAHLLQRDASALISAIRNGGKQP